MGVSCTTYCIEENVAAPEIGDEGFVGYPSSEIEKKHNEEWGITSYSFGWIYDGFKSIGLIPHCVEAFKIFLETCSGKTIVATTDHDETSFHFDDGNLNQFELPEDGFIDGIYTLSCEESGETFACEYSELLKPLSKTTLTRDDMDHFLERILDTSDFFDCFHNPPPCIGPYEDLPRLIAFIKENRDKTVHVSIREEFA